MIRVKANTQNVDPAKHSLSHPDQNLRGHQTGIEPTRSFQRLIGGPLPISSGHSRTGTLIGLSPPRKNTPHWNGKETVDFTPAAGINPLIEAIQFAFNSHYPLTLSPDDVWLCISQGFAEHVKQNAEELRHRFVQHEGKAKIEVVRMGWRHDDPNNDWQGVFPEFSEGIAQHIGKSRDMLVADFSTTTIVEKAASEIVLMDAMSAYFQYRMRTCCGIPYVNLLGDVSDWKSIRNRAFALSEYGVGWWTDHLIPVLDKICAAAAGQSDPAFWESLYKTMGGSGGPYVNGWVNALFPYLKRGCKNNGLAMGQYGPNPDDFPVGMSKVEFTMEGAPGPMEFLAGFSATLQDEESFAIQPSIGWAVRLKDAPVEAEAPVEDPKPKGRVQGQIWKVSGPEFVGRIPARTEIAVLSADEPHPTPYKSLGLVNGRYSKKD